MPLPLLLMLVIGGIAGIAVILHLLGLSRPLAFPDENAARAAWLNEFPDAPPSRVVLSHDHHAALIETSEREGIVWPMGADSTARYLDGARIDRTQEGLVIRLPDYTAPRIRLRLAPEEADLWARDIKEHSS
ncbi:hypothetical protein PGB28_20995 [Primorskyibacter aestuariivivens]|uniref:hypothetical protein n=1 Tax=Primorskyibacter aestuariivivens TaxID=1888912 RepID=UPI002300E888|nr:hypothetical protein [Primorskyibacter aestuariivivens]MDA7430942.1 hypothetical protein [Primorskyibacter aestuariivivens]